VTCLRGFNSIIDLILEMDTDYDRRREHNLRIMENRRAEREREDELIEREGEFIRREMPKLKGSVKFPSVCVTDVSPWIDIDIIPRWVRLALLRSKWNLIVLAKKKEGIHSDVDIVHDANIWKCGEIDKIMKLDRGLTGILSKRDNERISKILKSW